MKKYDTSQFEKDLASLGISITERQTEQFLTYYEMLVKWNQEMNLTAITEYEDVLKKHFIDSLSLVRACDLHKPLKVIDVGTGAGFPGLALKIAFPDLQVTLFDSLNKRIRFLDAVVAELGLSGVETVHGRAEDFAKPGAEGTLRETFDLCVSRAVANLSTLSEYCLPFVKVGGCFVSYKSEKAAEEITSAGKAVSLLGARLLRVEKFQLPDSDMDRNLIVLEKVSPTPKTYPRKAGLPGKEPLV